MYANIVLLLYLKINSSWI